MWLTQINKMLGTFLEKCILLNNHHAFLPHGAMSHWKNDSVMNEGEKTQYNCSEIKKKQSFLM